jgi:hypothetical protein
MRHAEFWSRQSPWHRFAPIFDKLPVWVSYFFAVLCSAGLGYSLGSAQAGFLELRPDQMLLTAVAAFAVVVIFLLDLRRRNQDRRRAERAEQNRLHRETLAIQLLDPVDRKVMEALDQIATAKGIDRATLIPAVLKQYVARKSYEESRREHPVQLHERLTGQSEASAEWMKTVPAWLETLPGSLDVKERSTPYTSI